MHDVIALRKKLSAKVQYCSSFTAALRTSRYRGNAYPDGACDVGVRGREGRAYAILPIEPEKLMILHGAPDYAVA